MRDCPVLLKNGLKNIKSAEKCRVFYSISQKSPSPLSSMYCSLYITYILYI